MEQVSFRKKVQAVFRDGTHITVGFMLNDIKTQCYITDTGTLIKRCLGNYADEVGQKFVELCDTLGLGLYVDKRSWEIKWDFRDDNKNPILPTQLENSEIMLKLEWFGQMLVILDNVYRNEQPTSVKKI